MRSLTPDADPTVQVQAQRSHIWVGLLLGLLVAVVVGLLLTTVARRREKETHFGYEAPEESQLVRKPNSIQSEKSNKTSDQNLAEEIQN